MTTCANAQYYKPFVATSNKLFAAPQEVTDGYCLAFDSVSVLGGDSIYHHFGALNDTSTIQYPGCIGWGSPYCYRAEIPMWNGTLFRTDNEGTYWFRTVQDDTLRFDLDTPVGQSSTFFADVEQRFAIERSGPDTMTVLSHVDSVFTYMISHTTLNGDPISSGLDQQAIIIGKDLGLIRFIRIDSFPQVLRPLDLIGQKGPDLGLHRITSAIIHDHQPGDVIQTRNYTGTVLPFNQPFVHFKSTILTRTDTPDSVIYNIAWERFGPADTDFAFGTFMHRYSKHDSHAELPFDRFDGIRRTFRRYTYTNCPVPIWRLYREEDVNLVPCGEGGCWVAMDTQGPPSTSNSTLHLGVGISSYFMDPPISWGTYYFDIHSIVYFKKDGVECGNELHVGLEAIQDDPDIIIYPNPAHGSVMFKSSHPIRSVEILDGQGRVVIRASAMTTRLTVMLSGLSAGWYLATIDMIDGNHVRSKLLVVD